jgi:hypothetical protein
MARVDGDALGRRTRVLALLGLVGICEFLLAAVALHAVSIRNEPSHMSEFVHSRFWLVWVLGLYTFVLGCAALIFGLRPWLQRTRWAGAGMALLALAGLAAFVLATFPVDEGRYETTLIGTIHNDATLTTFMMLSCAMVVLGPAFGATPGWKSFGRLSLANGVVVGALGVVYLVATEQDLPLAGYAQRVLVALIVSWFVLIALRLRHPDALPTPARSMVPARAIAPPIPAPAAVGPTQHPAPSPGPTSLAPAGPERSAPVARKPAARRKGPARGPRPQPGGMATAAATAVSSSRQSRSRTPRAT